MSAVLNDNMCRICDDAEPFDPEEAKSKEIAWIERCIADATEKGDFELAQIFYDMLDKMTEFV